MDWFVEKKDYEGYEDLNVEEFFDKNTSLAATCHEKKICLAI